MPGEFPFGKAEKAQFYRYLKKLCCYYVIKVTSFTVMGNHFHLKLHVPQEPPSQKETCKRYEQYYGGQKHLDPGSSECERISLMLRDLSCFMHDLQQQFSAWFNKTRKEGKVRRGSVWAGRFKSVLLEGGQAVWRCLVYQILNPVRARVVEDPADYRFSCWGLWSLNGWHPFAASITRHLLPYLGEAFTSLDLAEFRGILRSALTERLSGMELPDQDRSGDGVPVGSALQRKKPAAAG